MEQIWLANFGFVVLFPMPPIPSAPMARPHVSLPPPAPVCAALQLPCRSECQTLSFLAVQTWARSSHPQGSVSASGPRKKQVSSCKALRRVPVLRDEGPCDSHPHKEFRAALLPGASGLGEKPCWLQDMAGMTSDRGMEGEGRDRSRSHPSTPHGFAPRGLVGVEDSISLPTPTSPFSGVPNCF